MSAKPKALSQVAQAYARCKPARDVLHSLGNARCMEVLEDKAGVLVERWVLVPPESNTCINVVLFATPHFWDVFAPVTRSTKTDETLAAIRALAQGEQ